MITTSTAVLLTVLGNQPKHPPVSTPTHEITYMVIPDGRLYCLMSRLQSCESMRQTIIQNGGVIKPDGTFRVVKYQPYMPPEINKCGVIYNPKDGKSYNYKC